MVSRVQKYEYNPIPTMATTIPTMFLAVKGSCSRVYPNPRTRHVFKCPNTWYVTGDVFPITKNVLKFTNTAMEHDSTMKTMIMGEYVKAKTFLLVRHWSKKGPETKRMAAWKGDDWYRS